MCVDIVCPEALPDGRKLRLALSDGSAFDVYVPESIGAGQSFRAGPLPTKPGLHAIVSSMGTMPTVPSPVPMHYAAFRRKLSELQL